MSNLENEVWVDTYLSTHHEVSNMGRVRSKDRYLKKSGNLILFKSKILKGSIAYGYIRFRFSTEKREYIAVGGHQLVYHSFYNTKPVKGMVVDHIDGNKTNNNLNNLQFITVGENVRKGKTHTERKLKLPLNITKVPTGYHVRRSINGKIITFASVKTLVDAIKRRDELIKLNWPKPVKDNKTKYIVQRKNPNKFGIQKSFSDGVKWFGYFHTLEEAIERRNELIKLNWPEPIEHKNSKYITQNKKSNKFVIQKIFSGKIKRFGTFETLEEAIERRDALIGSNWFTED